MLLAVVIFGWAVAAVVARLRYDAPVARFFLDAKIPHKAVWLLAIGELGRPLAPIFLLLLWAWAEKRPRLLLAGLLAMLLTLCTVPPIKSAVGRIRPDENPAKIMAEPFYKRSYSFPSGDATLAFAVATVVAASIPVSARWIPFLLAAMAGVTRLMLLRHFASDVVAGAALGILCGVAALWISRSGFFLKMLSRAPPKWRRPALGIGAIAFLIGDALTRGPVTKNFLPIFWPVVAFMLIAFKGPAWLRFHGAHDVRVPARRVWAIFFFICGVIVAIRPFQIVLEVFGCELLLFGPAAAIGLIGGYWAAEAMWRGNSALAAVRIVAISVLMVGMANVSRMQAW